MPADITALYRNRLANERGHVKKNRGGKMAVALTYPNYYRLGMANLGFQLVYKLLNDRTDVVAERFFLPEGQEMSLYLRAGKPLVSLETQIPLASFDLIAFSISFENDYPNIIKILELGKIHPLSKERAQKFPLVMAGGITTFLNPEPLVDFVDLFLLGEAESNLNEFINLYIEYALRLDNKKESLKYLAKSIPTVYVPSLYETTYNNDGTIKSFIPVDPDIPEKVKVAHSAVTEIHSEEMIVSPITTKEIEFGERVLVESGRGCGRSCRFCAAGYVYRPPRHYSENFLKSAVDKATEKCGQVGILGASVSDVSGIVDLTSRILNKGCRFSLSSLRADCLTPDLISNLKNSGQKTITIAPEAGSERLRKVLNKHLTASQIIDSARMISGVEGINIRLYFLIGLPTETNQDIEEIVKLVKGIKHQVVKFSAPRGRIAQIKLSINCFVPKPFTPFQWLPSDHTRNLKEKQKRLRKALLKEGGIKVNTDIPKWAYIQTLMSKGNRRVSSILWLVHKFNGDWNKALHTTEVNPDFFVYREMGEDEILPWDFIDNGILKKHLLSEYRSALSEKESDPCSPGECYRCGVCRPQ